MPLVVPAPMELLSRLFHTAETSILAVQTLIKKAEGKTNLLVAGSLLQTDECDGWASKRSFRGGDGLMMVLEG